MEPHLDGLTAVLMVLLFGSIPTIVLASSIPSLSGIANWTFLVFVGLGAVLALDFIDFHFVTKRFRKKWILLNPEPEEEKDSKTLQIGPEKLTQGVLLGTSLPVATNSSSVD